MSNRYLYIVITTILFTSFQTLGFSYTPNRYFRAEIGGSFENRIENDNDAKKHKSSNTPIFSAAFGSIINYNYNLEVQLSYIPPFSSRIIYEDKFSKISVSHMSALLNLYYTSYDFNDFFPYAMVGVGIGRSKAGTLKHYDENMELAKIQKGGITSNLIWNYGVGFLIQTSKNIYVDVAVKQTNYGKLKIGEQIDDGDNDDIPLIKLFGKQKITQASISIRYLFNLLYP